MGQTRPWRHVRVESVLPPTLDIGRRRWYGSFVPIPDSCTAANYLQDCGISLDLVGARKQHQLELLKDGGGKAFNSDFEIVATSHSVGFRLAVAGVCVGNWIL